jgi:hypothetical protein
LEGRLAAGWLSGLRRRHVPGPTQAARRPQAGHLLCDGCEALPPRQRRRSESCLHAAVMVPSAFGTPATACPPLLCVSLIGRRSGHAPPGTVPAPCVSPPAAHPPGSGCCPPSVCFSLPGGAFVCLCWRHPPPRFSHSVLLHVVHVPIATRRRARKGARTPYALAVCVRNPSTRTQQLLSTAATAACTGPAACLRHSRQSGAASLTHIPCSCAARVQAPVCGL